MTPVPTSEPAVRIDASGLFCPLPVLEIAKAARRLSPGAVVELVATDPGVQADLRAWCEATGHLLLSLAREGSAYIARVRLGGGQPG